MTIFTIANGSTDKDLDEFIGLFKEHTSAEHCIKARINFSYPIPAPESDPRQFPLTIQTDDGIMFCILNLAAGYVGESPNAMCQILSLCGFKFDKDLILENSEGEPVKFILEKTACGTKYQPIAS